MLVPMGLVAAYQAQPLTNKRKDALLDIMSRSFYSIRGNPSPSLQRYCVTLAVTLEESIEKDLRRFNEQDEAYNPSEPDDNWEPMKLETDKAVKEAIEDAVSTLPFTITRNHGGASTVMIHVRDLWGDEFPVWVQPEALVKDLAMAIEVARGWQLDDIRIIFKGKQLEIHGRGEREKETAGDVKDGSPELWQVSSDFGVFVCGRLGADGLTVLSYCRWRYRSFGHETSWVLRVNDLGATTMRIWSIPRHWHGHC